MKRFLGGIWPVVQREMRESARSLVNHRLRFWSALAGAALLWLVVRVSERPADQLGGWLFAWLHTLMLGLIILIFPGLTADCLARERREGTLGLLFMTPLSAGGIVAGKALTHGLRAFTFWLAALPVLTVPFLAGGVAWIDTFSALSVQFCAGTLCLAAGLLASSVARERNTVFVLAYLFAAIILILCAQFCQFFVWAGWLMYVFPAGFNWWRLSLLMGIIFTGLTGPLGFRGSAGWASLTILGGTLAKIWSGICLIGPFVALLLFWIVARRAARRIEHSWQEKGSSPWRESLIRRYGTPVLRRRFRDKMRRLLDGNPIAWLQQYSWQARAGTWLLCLGIVLVECVAGCGDEWMRPAGDQVLLFVLAAIYTFVGVSGFLEEKRSGALELLLVTPLSVNRLILGRAVGLWGRFLPGALALTCFCLVNEWTSTDDPAMMVWERSFFVAICAFLTLPIFATYFALRVKNLFAAAMLTWIALAIPAQVISDGRVFTIVFMHRELPQGWVALGLAVSYAAFAWLTFFLLRHSLSRRIYSFA